MLQFMNPWKPSEEAPMIESKGRGDSSGMWELGVDNTDTDRRSSYIV